MKKKNIIPDITHTRTGNANIENPFTLEQHKKLEIKNKAVLEHVLKMPGEKKP